MAEGTKIRLSCLLAGNVYECIRDLEALHPLSAIMCASEIKDCLHRRDKILFRGRDMLANNLSKDTCNSHRKEKKINSI